MSGCWACVKYQYLSSSTKDCSWRSGPTKLLFQCIIDPLCLAACPLSSICDYVGLLNTFSIGTSGDLERKFKSENIGTEVQKKLRSQRCGLLSEKEVGKHRLSIEWTLLIVVHLSACQRNKYFRKGHSPHRIQCFFRFFSAQTCVIFLKRTNLQKNSAQRCVSLLIGHSWFVVPLSAFQRNKYLRRDTLAEGLFGEKCRMNRDFLFYSWEQPFLFCNLY